MATPTATPVAGRFIAPALLNLGPPPDLASLPFLTLKANSIQKLVTDMAGIGITYNVDQLESDPAIILTEDAAYRDMLRRREIDDAVAETYTGSSDGAWLDRRASDYGVLRRTVAAAIPSSTTEPVPRDSSVPPAWAWTPAVNGAGACWTEDDTSLRNRAYLAWEALSVAGPAGAYIFHSLDAHPDVRDAVAYGPESGYVNPGEVLVVVQSFSNNGVPNNNILDAIAARLDAYQITDQTGAITTRIVRDTQSIRPLGAKVLLEACQPLSYYIDATLYVSPGSDAAAMKIAAATRLATYLDKRNHIGMLIPFSGLEAALSVTDAGGMPTVDEVVINHPSSDITPTYQQLATSNASPILNVLVR